MDSNKRRNGFVIMAKLVSLLGSFAYFLIFAVINGSLGFLCAMGVTVFGSLGIAKALGENLYISYTAIIIITVACGVLRGILRYIEQYSNHYIAFKLLYILRDKIFKALRKLAPARLEDKKKGDIIALVTADVETLEVFYAHTLSPILICIVVNTIVLIFVGIFTSWYLSIVAVSFYAIIGVFVPLISSYRLKSTGVAYRNEFAAFNAYYLDSIKGIKDIVLHNGDSKRKEEVNKRSSSLLAETKKQKKSISIQVALVELFISIAIIIATIVGVILVSTNNITLGRMIVGLVTIISSFGPVVAISNLPGNLTQTFASGNRMLDLLAEKPKTIDVINKNNIDFTECKFKNVDFSYTDEIVLNNASFEAKKGEIIGIVGESGSGKSTILKLLLRFYEKNSGAIELNNIDINQINTESLLNNVTMVSQNTYLFDDTILENLKIANPSATKEEIELACMKASIHEFIMSLPERYNTRVGGALDNISAGEKQRIGLARAFLRGANLILLDEPTSNVDSINEGIILKSLLLQKNDKCIILVSHRESTMSIADRVYKFSNHSLVEL